MTNFYGVLASIGWVVFILGLSSIIEKKFHFSEETNRKFVHIGVSNFWLIAMYFFTDRIWASVVPILFVIVNSLSYRYTLLSSMERKKNKDLGTIYYPISLTILTLATFSVWSAPYVGALGIFVMGYGDGLAALIGKKWGKRVFPLLKEKKTFVGSSTMFVVSLMVSCATLEHYHPHHMWSIGLVLASFATIIELVTPRGLDNLTVPLGVSLIYQIFFFT